MREIFQQSYPKLYGILNRKRHSVAQICNSGEWDRACACACEWTIQQ
jgi:hypothetical protein